MVAGYKRCPNGHYYKDELTQCPYCSIEAGSSDVKKDPKAGDAATMPGIGNMDDNKRMKTVPEMGGTSKLAAAETINLAATSRRSPLSKTMIFDNDPETSIGDAEVRSSRKLVGWLVSYTLNDMGVDFKLFEGRNIIGRDLDCQVSVNDSTVSAKHAILLYRAGRYSISDNQSTLGTFVNDEDIELTPRYLNDGDIIRIGKTVFKFRTSF